MILLKDFVSVDWNKMKAAVSQNRVECIQWVKKYIELGIEFRSYRVEAFERECRASKSEFEKIALEMGINGDCPEYCFTVLGNFMHAGEMGCLEYFQNIIIFQFMMLESAESVPADLLIKVLGSLLGLSLFVELKAEYMQYFHQDL